MSLYFKVALVKEMSFSRLFPGCQQTVIFLPQAVIGLGIGENPGATWLMCLEEISPFFRYKSAMQQIFGNRRRKPCIFSS
jgi:hypothetical protein